MGGPVPGTTSACNLYGPRATGRVCVVTSITVSPSPFPTWPGDGPAGTATAMVGRQAAAAALRTRVCNWAGAARPERGCAAQEQKLASPEAAGQEENRRKTGSFTLLVSTGHEASALRQSAVASLAVAISVLQLLSCF